MVASSEVIVATSINTHTQKYPYKGSYLHFSRDFYFHSVRVTAMLILAIVCNKDYLHVVITIKVANFSDQSFFSRLIALFLLPKN